MAIAFIYFGRPLNQQFLARVTKQENYKNIHHLFGNKRMAEF